MRRLQLVDSFGFFGFFCQREMLSFLFPGEGKGQSTQQKSSYMQNRNTCKITIKHRSSLHILVFNDARIKTAWKMLPSF